MFKYILVPATGAASDPSVFATAAAVARLSAAHLVFLHVRPDDQINLAGMTATSDLSDGIDYYSALDALERLAAERCRKAELAVREFCEREQLAVPGQPSLDRPSAEWKLEIGDEISCLADHGRQADLMVLGRVRDHEVLAMDVLQAALVGTGRPVLIAAADPPARITGTVAIAWKNTAEAARAVTAARPFIESAGRVIVFSVEEGVATGPRPADRLRDALTWHNRETSVQHLERRGRSAVETLLGAVEAAGADLLVMGGYGHSRFRELIFGGFTRHVLNGAALPVLMAH